MLFNSLQFLVFFPIVVILYFALPPRFRWPLLLAGSYYFYACWRLEYLSLIIISTVVDYIAGIRIGAATGRAGKRLWLLASLFVNLGFLFVFKYFNFFSDSTRAFFELFDATCRLPELNVLLPVGISFYTFQTLSYTIDVYNGRRPPERHLGIFAVYVSFFPQLVAGPIERSTRLLPQFFRKMEWDRERAFSGARLMLWGFFKKIVIADRLAQYVDQVYAAPGACDGTVLLIASFFFAFQIYCDFSGYSDIAIGAARIMGYDLMTNFRQPYFARSIREFWQRWHISLSTWFRDYVYIPMGGGRVSRFLQYRNLILTFLVSGLWHGANWTFIVWGGLHGLYLAVSNLTGSLRRTVTGALCLDRAPALHAALQAGFIFLLVLVGWVFFRAADIGEALMILGRIAKSLGRTPPPLPLPAPFDMTRDLFFIFGLIGALSLYDFFLYRESKLLEGPMARTVLGAAQFWIIMVYGVFDNYQFIYFQF